MVSSSSQSWFAHGSPGLFHLITSAFKSQSYLDSHLCSSTQTIHIDHLLPSRQSSRYWDTVLKQRPSSHCMRAGKTKSRQMCQVTASFRKNNETGKGYGVAVRMASSMWSVWALIQGTTLSQGDLRGLGFWQKKLWLQRPWEESVSM